MPVPEDTKLWKKQSSAKSEIARALCNRMKSTLKGYEDAEAADKASQMDWADREAERLKAEARARMKIHQDAIDASQDYSRKIITATCKLDSVLKKIMHERYARHGDIQVCDKRLEKRNERPEVEIIKDCLQLALEEEKALLASQREEMLAREDEVKKYRENLSKLRSALTKDTGHRRMVNNHEQEGIRVAKDVATGKMKMPTWKAISTTDSHLKKANFMLRPHGDVEKFCNRSLELVERSQTDSKITYMAMMKRFEKRNGEVLTIKHRLEEELKDLGELINLSENDLEKYTKRADPTDVGRQAELKSSKSLLSQLKNTKEELHNDLLNKIHCLEIDYSCRRVRPMNAYEASADVEDEGQGAGNTFGLSKSDSAPCLPSVGSSRATFEAKAMQEAKAAFKAEMAGSIDTAHRTATP